MAEPIDFPLNPDAEFIELCDLLKVTGLADSGGIAKQRIAAGEVKVDGTVDTRKRAKIRAGQVVEIDGRSIRVTSA